MSPAEAANKINHNTGSDFTMADALNPDFLNTDGEAEGGTVLTPEEQLRNVAAVMLRYSKVRRLWNGKGRSSTYAGNTDMLAHTGQQLAELVLKYLDGGLVSIPKDEIPF